MQGIQALLNAFVLLCEPRRGGTSVSAGGRMGFVASAFIDHIWDDPDDLTHAFVGFRFFCELVYVMAEAVRWGKRRARINTISAGIIMTPHANDELKVPNGDLPEVRRS